MKLVLALSLLLASPVLAADPPPKAKAETKNEKKAPPADKPAAEKPTEKPAGNKEVMSPQEAKQVEAFFDDLFAAVIGTQTACPKMGPAINAVVDKHAALLQKAAGSEKEPPPALKAKMEKKQGDFVNALMKCSSDKGVTAALERMTKMAQAKR